MTVSPKNCRMVQIYIRINVTSLPTAPRGISLFVNASIDQLVSPSVGLFALPFFITTLISSSFYTSSGTNDFLTIIKSLDVLFIH